MSGSRYMTTAVAEMMVRLNAIVGRQSSTASMLSGAIDYLRQQTAREVKEMKEDEAKAAQKAARNGKKGEAYQATPSEVALHYLYIVAMDGTCVKLKAPALNDMDYLLGKLKKMTGSLTIYGKAKAAVILALNYDYKTAADYLKSMEEYSVYREDMGRYYDTRKAYYSWRNYKIPTEVAAIEALQALDAQTISASLSASSAISKQQTIEEMQRWLLMSKRTQEWKDNPVNVVDAVYAFMQGNEKIGTDRLTTPSSSSMARPCQCRRIPRHSDMSRRKELEWRPNSPSTRSRTIPVGELSMPSSSNLSLR